MDKEADKLRREQAAKDARARKLDLAARKKRQQKEAQQEKKRKAAEVKKEKRGAYNQKRREQYHDELKDVSTKKEQKLFAEIAKLQSEVAKRNEKDAIADAQKIAVEEYVGQLTVAINNLRSHPVLCH